MESNAIADYLSVADRSSGVSRLSLWISGAIFSWFKHGLTVHGLKKQLRSGRDGQVCNLKTFSLFVCHCRMISE